MQDSQSCLKFNKLIDNKRLNVRTNWNIKFHISINCNCHEKDVNFQHGKLSHKPSFKK